MILLNTNKIRNKTYDSILELCEDVVDAYESLNRFPSDEDTSDISFIAKYNEAKEIISHLCKLEYDIAFCQLADPEYDGYIDEYIITIYDGEIWCEPLKREDEYIYCESHFSYILDNCSSKVLENVKQIIFMKFTLMMKNSMIFVMMNVSFVKNAKKTMICMVLQLRVMMITDSPHYHSIQQKNLILMK